jgi:hypothetical protein
MHEPKPHEIEWPDSKTIRLMDTQVALGRTIILDPHDLNHQAMTSVAFAIDLRRQGFGFDRSDLLGFEARRRVDEALGVPE